MLWRAFRGIFLLKIKLYGGKNMAKISPASIKYMIHATFRVEGALEKPDVIGAIFGQTEGLLGSELEMRELQKEGKIGRIEVELERNKRITSGTIKVPTALDQSETTLIAAALETIEKMGPSDSQIEVERIEDVRGSKRDYIIDRAKELMGNISSKTDSREISKEIKESAKTAAIQKYGDENLPAGDLSGKEIVVVEGRADVLNLLRAGVTNAIGMNGTKLPDGVKELTKEKETTLFVDGDRGGKLIVKNVVDNAEINYIAFAPDGKEVEELSGKEILQCLRKKISIDEYNENVNRNRSRSRGSRSKGKSGSASKPEKSEKAEKIKLTDNIKEELKKISEKNKGSNKALFLDASLKEIKEISSKSASRVLKKAGGKPSIIVIDGTATKSVLKGAEDAGVSIIVAKTFTSTDTNLELLSF